MDLAGQRPMHYLMNLLGAKTAKVPCMCLHFVWSGPARVYINLRLIFEAAARDHVAARSVSDSIEHGPTENSNHREHAQISNHEIRKAVGLKRRFSLDSIRMSVEKQIPTTLIDVNHYSRVVLSSTF